MSETLSPVVLPRPSFNDSTDDRKRVTSGSGTRRTWARQRLSAADPNNDTLGERLRLYVEENFHNA